MSVADLFEPKAEAEEESEVETENKEEALSKRELRRRTEAIHIGRKADTRAKRKAKKLLEKIKVNLISQYFFRSIVALTWNIWS